MAAVVAVAVAVAAAVTAAVAAADVGALTVAALATLVVLALVPVVAAELASALRFGAAPPPATVPFDLDGLSFVCALAIAAAMVAATAGWGSGIVIALGA